MSKILIAFENKIIPRRLFYMLDLLKSIPLIQDISMPNSKGEIAMKIADLPAKGYSCNLSWILAIYLVDSCDLSLETLCYVSCLLGGHHDIHDFSCYFSDEKSWLCCVYDKKISAEVMAREIEIHLALTRYFRYLILSKQHPCQVKEYEAI
ncbi:MULTISPECIES: pathogenicity island protein [unclassified Symbiopectobacterium]|uniref:pathogenicity island protein n=1 Tax=unclassified Symbiopectobacterium TaxID=2794573 RepID=UPI002225ECDB|nr:MULTISPECIES: pathogenicity island protein [unclassified Symbiopectobacterium]MCW2475003.1 pathogenicity island protein [Candidatus Symbiopectobacterium sp. NZEC151]MCW2486817.1 pathogenicity island protein [Candidatus Symbiopectobacterium sp. NZEC127]